MILWMTNLFNGVNVFIEVGVTFYPIFGMLKELK
jgi:hypothetical protein